MKRSWGIGVLRCPNCSGRMKLVAAIEGPTIVHRILCHLGMPTTGPPPPEPWRRQTDLVAEPVHSHLDRHHDPIDPPCLFE